MKSLIVKIWDAFGKKQAGRSAVTDHPNFWMYG